MTWNSTALPARRGRLARYLGHLRHNLDAVGEQMREAVAHAVGRSVAEAVRETVYDALVSHTPTSSPLSSAAHRSSTLASPLASDWDEPDAQRQADAAFWPDRYEVDDELPRCDEEGESDEAPSRSGLLRLRRWQQALAASVQAAAWWLQRQRGPISYATALTVAIVAGLTVLAGPLEQVGAVAASALGLTYLLKLLHAASNLLAAHISAA